MDLLAGFRYDANCPPYFVDDFEMCAIEYVYSRRSLAFRSDNDLVAMTTDPHSITDACRYVCVCVCVCVLACVCIAAAAPV